MKVIKKLLLLSLIMVGNFIFISSAFSATTYSKVVFFGDSLSDIHNNQCGTQDQAPIVDKVADGKGGYVDGDMWVKPFVTNLRNDGLLRDDASPEVLPSRILDEGQKYDGSANYDFAYSGDPSNGYEENVIDPDAIYYHAQDNQPFSCSAAHPLPGSNAICGMINRVYNYHALVPSVDPEALYILWVGPNDIEQRLAPGLQQRIESGDVIDPNTYDPQAAEVLVYATSNIFLSVDALANKGAKHFMVMNLPNLAYTPEGYFSNQLYLQKHPGQEHVIDQLFTNLTNNFNQLLTQKLDMLQKSKPITIARPDVGQLFDMARAGKIKAFPPTSADVNVKNILPWYDVCCSGTKLPNYNPQDCKPIDQMKAACDPSHMARMSNKLGNFLFFNAIHPTACVHQYLAKFFESYLPGGPKFDPNVNLCEM